MISKYDINNEVKRFILKNDFLQVNILNYGCIIERIIYKGQDMVLTYSDHLCYINNSAYVGAVVGRVAGRIENCTVNNFEGYNLDDNDNGNHLHGGINGLSNKIFNYRIKDDAIYLSYYDDCEKYYPGKVHFTVKYSIDKASLKVEYFATVDKPTYINMTNHSYFNLHYPNSGLEHMLTINADKYFKLKPNMIVEDNPSDVDNTIFDFRNKKSLKKDIDNKNSQFDISYYFDHTFLLNKNNDYDAILESNISNIKMKVKTDNRAVVMYAGNFLEEKHLGISLETQDVPNGINNGYFNLTTKDNPYYSYTIYSFEMEEK